MAIIRNRRMGNAEDVSDYRTGGGESKREPGGELMEQKTRLRFRVTGETPRKVRPSRETAKRRLFSYTSSAIGLPPSIIGTGRPVGSL